MKVSADIARAVLTGKIANSRTVLQRALRDHADKIAAEEVDFASKRLSNHLEQLNQKRPLDEVRGCEGDAAHTYFGVFDHLIVAQKESFSFQERRRRPPRRVSGVCIVWPRPARITASECSILFLSASLILRSGRYCETS